MNVSVAYTLAMLVLMGKLTPAEANLLQAKLPGTEIPGTWAGVILQWNNIIGRTIDITS